MLQHNVLLLLWPQPEPESMFDLGLILIQMGEDREGSHVDGDLEVVQGRHHQITLAVTADEEDLLVVPNPNDLVLVLHLDGGLGQMDDLGNHKRLVGNQKGVIQLQFLGMRTVNPYKSPLLAIQVLDGVVLVDDEVLPTDDFGIEADSHHLEVWFLKQGLLSPAEEDCLVAGEGELGANFLIVGFAFEDGEREVEVKGVVGQFVLSVYDLIGDIFGIGHLPE